MSRHLQIITELAALTETQARIIAALATRLAELGDVETGKNEIAAADKVYRKLIGGGDLPDIPTCILSEI